MKLDKASLRARYTRVAVNDPAFVRGRKGHTTVGAGKFGKVKAARDTRTGDDVVVKSQSKQWRRTISERIIHRGLNLPHVVRCLDIATGPRKRYLVMERCTPLQLEGGLSVERAVDLSQQLIDAVQSLHAVGVYHRDIAVRNMYTKGDVLKLSDFGLAVSQPSRYLRKTYEHEDALDACRVIVRLLNAADVVRAGAFEKWYRRTTHLTPQIMRGAPALQAGSQVSAAPRGLPLLHGVRRVHMLLVRGFLPIRLGPPAPPVPH